MWMLNMTTIYNFGNLSFNSMQKENKKTPEYNSLSSIFDGVAATAQFYAFLCKKEKNFTNLTL